MWIQNVRIIPWWHRATGRRKQCEEGRQAPDNIVYHADKRPRLVVQKSGDFMQMTHSNFHIWLVCILLWSYSIFNGKIYLSPFLTTGSVAGHARKSIKITDFIRHFSVLLYHSPTTLFQSQLLLWKPCLAGYRDCKVFYPFPVWGIAGQRNAWGSCVTSGSASCHDADHNSMISFHWRHGYFCALS